MREALQSPILGQGFGKPFTWYFGSQALEVSSHNGYIMYFYKMGLIGMVLLFMALFHWYRELRQYVRIEIDEFKQLLAYALQICMSMILVYSVFYQPPAFI